MRVLIAIVGTRLVALMLSEFFVAFMLPRRVRRDPRIACGLDWLLWRRWRALARRLEPARRRRCRSWRRGRAHRPRLPLSCNGLAHAGVGDTWSATSRRGRGGRRS
jgi:hypothetical protein